MMAPDNVVVHLVRTVDDSLVQLPTGQVLHHLGQIIYISA